MENSAGPTHDGRIKPELVALGVNGTSEAAALVSGISGYLQGEIESRTGEFPQSSLVKAILISSAKDVGKSGIDWETGYERRYFNFGNGTDSIEVIPGAP